MTHNNIFHGSRYNSIKISNYKFYFHELCILKFSLFFHNNFGQFYPLNVFFLSESDQTTITKY